MTSISRLIAFYLCLFSMTAFSTAIALAKNAEQAISLDHCAKASTKCILDYTAQQVKLIDDQRWRDQSIRDLVMRYADAGHHKKALALIPSVSHPDTRAMSIRAAGMGRAKYSTDTTVEANIAYFDELKQLAETISHDGAKAIAYTYIAMSEAFAGLDKDATKTALSMDNSALRNKALAESAEIQAERGDIDASLASISHIDDNAFKDKAYTITAEIFIKTGRYEDAMNMAARISNAYKQSKVLLKLTGDQINEREKQSNNSFGQSE